MGSTTGGDTSSDGQACALEQLVDSLLMEASEAYERSICESKNTVPQKVAFFFFLIVFLQCRGYIN